MKTLIRSFLSILIVFVTVDSLIKNVICSEKVIDDEKVQDESFSQEKRLDKLKYFGGLGKRTYEFFILKYQKNSESYSLSFCRESFLKYFHI